MNEARQKQKKVEKQKQCSELLKQGITVKKVYI